MACGCLHLASGKSSPNDLLGLAMSGKKKPNFMQPRQLHQVGSFNLELQDSSIGIESYGPRKIPYKISQVQVQVCTSSLVSNHPPPLCLKIPTSTLSANGPRTRPLRSTNDAASGIWSNNALRSSGVANQKRSK